MLTLFRRAAVAAFGVEFLFVFLLGGAVQLIGLLSNTGMTVLLAGMSIAVLSVDMLWRGRLATPSVIVWGMIAAAVLCTSWALAESPPLYLAGSLIWVVVPAATYYLVRGGLRSLPVAVIIKMFVAVSVIQLPVMALQRLFYDQIAGTAVQEIAYVDIVFGTFFVKADHSLSFLLLALIIFALFNPRARTLLPYRRYLIGLWIVTILFTNSHMGHLLLMVVLIGYAFDRVRPRCDRALQVIGATLTIAVVCVGVIIFLASRVPDLQVLSSRLARQVTLGESVARYAVILLILSEPISLLGHGPFSYYNPITKEWGIHGGHSQWYSITYDFGFAGLAIFLAFMIMIGARSRGATREWPWYLATLVAYALVSQALTDLAMLMTYFCFLSLGRGEEHTSAPPGLADNALASGIP